MKKIFYFVFTCMIILLCSACNGSVTRSIRHAGFNVGGKFICSRFYPKDKEDTSYLKVRYFTGSHMIDTNGNIYEVSMDQVYANKENCKEADTSIVVKAIMDNKIIKGTDDKYYYLVSQNGTPSYSEITRSDNSYYVYDLLLKDSNIVKVVTANSNEGSYYILKNDGNVYEVIVYTKDYNTPPAIVSSKIVYDRGEYGGDIIDFNYGGEGSNTYIKTADKIYRMKASNIDECTKYADIKCNYYMSEDTELEKYIDRIIIYSGNFIVTDYKQVFNAK